MFFVFWTNRTYRHNSELHFVGNVQLALLQDLAEVEEHPGVPVHALDEAKAVAYGGDHALEGEESPSDSVRNIVTIFKHNILQMQALRLD